MGERLPRLTATELLAALAADGWKAARQRGSHLHLKHPVKPGRLTVPVHSGRIIKTKTLQTILDVAELSADDLRRLL